MTFATEVAKVNPAVEFFICIEGVGWAVDDGDLSQGFAGTIFATNDLNGTLLSVLGAGTLHKTLMLPTSIEDSYDPLTRKYEHGGMAFEILETEDDDIMSTIFRPLATAYSNAVLDSALSYEATSVVLTDGTNFAAGDVAWIGGREAVLLGTKSGAGPHTYASSTRGYLGTPQGRRDSVPTTVGGFSWKAGVAVLSKNPYWYNRRCQLFVHVPGETVGNCVRLYAGIIRGAQQSDLGVRWRFQTVYDEVGQAQIVRQRPTAQKVFNNTLNGWQNEVDEINALRRGIQVQPDSRGVDRDYEYYAAAFSYDYRNRVSGGTKGVITAIDADDASPQARLDDDSIPINFSMLDIGGHLLRAYRKAEAGSTVDGNMVNAIWDSHRWIETQAVNQETASGYLARIGLANNLFPDLTPVTFTLDNQLDDATRSWFSVNNSVRRHVIDVLLMFLTSMDDEYLVFDAQVGSTTTDILRTSGTFADDEWNGYALHSVEDGNIGESRLISDTVNATNKVVVDNAFSSSATATKEYHIRNTVYDVLPIGWGFGIHHTKINLDSARTIKSRYLHGAHVGKFIISTKDKIDMWQVLKENILEPHGILLRLNRKTGILDFDYVGSAVQDGLFGDYTAVSADELLDVGTIDHMPHRALGSVTLKVRADGTVLRVKDAPISTGGSATYITQIYDGTEAGGVQPLIDGDLKTITVRDDDANTAFTESFLESVTRTARLNDSDSADWLVQNAIADIKRTASPYPQVRISLAFNQIADVQTGSLIAITDTTQHNPPNPYSSSRGWSGLAARVVSTAIVFDEENPGLRCTVQLLPTVNHGRIAPAMAVSAKGNDGSYDYFETANAQTYSNDTGATDLSLFVAGDYIELRSADGALKEAEQIQDVQALRIRVVGTITSTIVAGDYVTFGAWDSAAANTTNMDKYAAQADDNETLGGSNDAAIEYI